MTLRHYYRDVDGSLTDMSQYAPRFVQAQSRAEESAVGSWSVVLDDPLGELDIAGHRNWFIEDDASEDEDDIIWGGFTGAQTIARMQGEDRRKIGPLARVITVQLFDANTYLARIVMKGSDTNRPAETDVERMDWLLGTDEADALGDVTTYFGTAGPVNMDAAPLRGTFFGQIISDCAEQSGKNHFLFYRKESGTRKLTIWYARDFRPDYYSPFYLSNDPADLDEAAIEDGTATVWKLSDDATMERSPERQYCGCYLTYEGGATYRHNAATHALISGGAAHQHRDMTTYRPLVKTATKAQNRADRQLIDVQDQDVRIKTTMTGLPQERVTLIKAGMMVRVKGTHWWPSTEEWHLARVLTAEPRPFGPGRTWDIPLELSVIDPGPPGVVSGPPGPSVETAGAVLYQPGNFGPPATNFVIIWGSDGDSPGAGYGSQPRDATNFDYLGTLPAREGFEVLAATGSLDIAIKLSLADVGGPRTFTLKLLKNGGEVANGTLVQSGGGFIGGFITINATGLAVVAGDLLTTELAVTELSGLVVPWGVGDLSNRFEILNSSTVT